jgi:hypothetical protein
MGNNNQENKDQQNSQMDSDWNKGESSGGKQGSGAATKPAPGEGETPASDVYKNETGDPGRTPGKAEGVEDFQKEGNE